MLGVPYFLILPQNIEDSRLHFIFAKCFLPRRRLSFLRKPQFCSGPSTHSLLTRIFVEFRLSKIMSEDEKKVTLKLLVDTRARKVVFAEARKDFVDFLFKILSLPIGTVAELSNKEGMVGCLGDLCKSIEALDIDYLQPNVTRDMVTQPIVIGGNCVSISDNLMLLTDAASQKQFYRCGSGSYNNCRTYVSDSPNAICPQCNSKMSLAMTYVAPKGPTETATASSSAGVVAGEGYVKGVVTYMVMDNLEVKPMSTISCIALINKFNVMDVASLVEKVVQVGLKEWLAILKASLETRAALTSVFLGIKEEKNLNS